MTKAKMKLYGIPHLIEVDVEPKDNLVKLNGQRFQTNELSLDVPISGTVYGTLLNFKGAFSALNKAMTEAPYHEPPKAPILYIKPVNTFSGYNMPLPLPSHTQALEIGAALGVVIGQKATRVSEEQALSYVAGYTVVNDISIPHDSVYRPAVQYKARDGFCPIGPWIMDRSAVANPDELGIRVYINNELKQENTTANLIRPVARLIADVTDFMALHPGDVLLVGVPEKAPLATAGDTVRIEIDCVGVLENTVVREQELVLGVAK